MTVKFIETISFKIFMQIDHKSMDMQIAWIACLHFNISISNLTNGAYVILRMQK